MALKTRVWLGVVAALALAACSGGRTDDMANNSAAAPRASARGEVAPLPTPTEAARFLTQATFGPTDDQIAAVTTSGYAAWIDQQMAMPVSETHQSYVDARLVTIKAAGQAGLAPTQFYESFWKQAATSPDQLRQRVKLALSEIFVISMADPNIDVRGAASYYDVLGANAFGNYRTLLEQVALHPMMGTYLTWIANQKADPATGRHPDQNFARESMQLMSIGLNQLNPDGTPVLNGLGQPIATYSAADIAGLADVLTGYSWYSPKPTNNGTFIGRNKDPDATITAMIAYPTFHATNAKTFLGTTIPASAAADPAGDLKIGLDTLYNHPNVGPFISKQLIQRLVTSNPTPAYVGRVAAVFNNNGKGVRGDLGAVVKAILLDPEARDGDAAVADPNYGKLREPVVRLANWMRVTNATSASGNWTINSTAANTSLSQAPLTAPSVFNFWRPGYSPPSTKLGNLGYVAPEFQVVDEVTVAGYLNVLQGAISSGVGTKVDVTPDYSSWLQYATDGGALTDRINLLLMNGQMSDTLRLRIISAATAVKVPASGTGVQTALTNRIKLALYMAMASSEYIAQR